MTFVASHERPRRKSGDGHDAYGLPYACVRRWERHMKAKGHRATIKRSAERQSQEGLSPFGVTREADFRFFEKLLKRELD